MDNAVYSTLARQSGLMREMRVVANNIANVSTNGFRREGVIFTEHVAALGRNEPALAMAHATGRLIDESQGPLAQTGGTFDLAIEGPGYFLIATPEGDSLTRAGSFTLSPEGDLVTQDGYPVLDGGGAPIFIPPGLGTVAIARDGTISGDGAPVAGVGLFAPTDPNGLVHAGGSRFASEAGVEPLEEFTVLQGFLEESNINPITEIARMIEVQRAYELGQSFLEREDERVRAVISTLSR